MCGVSLDRYMVIGRVSVSPVRVNAPLQYFDQRESSHLGMVTWLTPFWHLTDQVLEYSSNCVTKEYITIVHTSNWAIARELFCNNVWSTQSIECRRLGPRDVVNYCYWADPPILIYIRLNCILLSFTFISFHSMLWIACDLVSRNKL